jgi:predicted nucleic acid-binding protein
MVIDASVLANVVGDDGVDGRRARGEVRIAGDVAAPDLVDVETVAVLRKRWLAGTLSSRRFAAAIARSMLRFAGESRRTMRRMSVLPKAWDASC